MKQLIKQSINSLVKSFDQELVSSSYLKILETYRKHIFCYHLKKLFDLLKIDCVIDVGANKGQYYKFLRQKVGYQGLVLSFEPLQGNVKIMQELAQKDPNWFIYGYALGSQNQTQTINIMNSNVCSSFLLPDDTHLPESKAKLKEYNTVIAQEEVTVKTLDSMLEILTQEHSFDNLFLKLDTQGYDLEVIKGAEQNLSRIRALQTEVSFTPIYDQMPSFVESYETMRQKGFKLTALFPVNTDRLLRMVEGDCVMVNENQQ